MFEALGARDLASILTLVAPAAALATLALLLAARIRRRRASAIVAKDAGSGARSAGDGALPLVAGDGSIGLADGRRASSAHRIGELQSAIATMTSADDKGRLASLYLEVAEAHLEAGDAHARMGALRSAAGLAARHGPRADHARARLALAEAAFESGDLTGACEQWQIARTALLEDGQTEAHDRVDRRMRDNGCPTDWVLTDF